MSNKDCVAGASNLNEVALLCLRNDGAGTRQGEKRSGGILRGVGEDRGLLGIVVDRGEGEESGGRGLEDGSDGARHCDGDVRW
jgi:hypothetical protein